MPVGLCIGKASDGSTSIWSTNGPSGLGDPDLLSLSDADGVVKSGVEGRVGVRDGDVLEVRVGVHGDDVNGVNDSDVGAVVPSVPGVNVGDFCLGSSSSGNECADLADVVDDGCRRSADTSSLRGAVGGVTVEVLATNGDGGDEVGEGSAVGGDGGAKSRELVVKVCLTSRSPHP